MKFTVKTVKGVVYPLDLEPTSTVSQNKLLIAYLSKIQQVKEKIASLIENTPVKSQKLIVMGKQLEDNTKTLTE